MKSKLSQILSGGILCAVGVGIESQNQARTVIEAMMDGGIDCFELMRGVPNNLQLLHELKATYPETIFGIGTVLSPQAAVNAIEAGADFLVSPYLNLDILKSCRRHGVISCFGALTPTEIMKGWEVGLDLVKVFPTNAMGGPDYIRTISAPLSHIRLVGAGGVVLEDVETYFKAGASLVAVDEDLMPPELIRSGDFAKLTKRAQEYREVLDKSINNST